MTPKYASLMVVAYVVAGILWALALRPGSPSLWLALMVGFVTSIPQGVRGITFGDVPSRPTEPVERVPKLGSVDAEPPTTIMEPSDRCEICNRSLSNPDSQLARVGSECIKTYGPRFMYIPNPAHAWRAALSQTQVELAAAKVRAKSEHRDAMRQYQSDFRAWQEAMLRPEVQEAIGRRKIHRRAASYGAVLCGVAYVVTSLIL